MKRELKRIEATLNQLTVPTHPRSDSAASPAQNPSPVTSSEPARSFVITPDATQAAQATQTQDASWTSVAIRQAFSVPNLQRSEVKTPHLPRMQSPSSTGQRAAANPALARNLLKEIETVVVQWQDELQAVLQQIQDLYAEGPIVDGWLESYAQEDSAVSTLRHADVECLMDYVEKQWNAAPPVAAPAAESARGRENLTNAGYRLCGLNEDGQLWFRHCPPDQVPAVSLAIVRYQKLRQLLNQKQHLETRLSQLAETLVGVHRQLQ